MVTHTQSGEVRKSGYKYHADTGTQVAQSGTAKLEAARASSSSSSTDSESTVSLEEASQGPGAALERAAARKGVVTQSKSSAGRTSTQEEQAEESTSIVSLEEASQGPGAALERAEEERTAAREKQIVEITEEPQQSKTDTITNILTSLGYTEEEQKAVIESGLATKFYTEETYIALQKYTPTQQTSIINKLNSLDYSSSEQAKILQTGIPIETYEALGNYTPAQQKTIIEGRVKLAENAAALAENRNNLQKQLASWTTQYEKVESGTEGSAAGVGRWIGGKAQSAKETLSNLSDIGIIDIPLTSIGTVIGGAGSVVEHAGVAISSGGKSLEPDIKTTAVGILASPFVAAEATQELVSSRDPAVQREALQTLSDLFVSAKVLGGVAKLSGKALKKVGSETGIILKPMAETPKTIPESGAKVKAKTLKEASFEEQQPAERTFKVLEGIEKTEIKTPEGTREYLKLKTSELPESNLPSRAIKKAEIFMKRPERTFSIKYKTALTETEFSQVLKNIYGETPETFKTIGESSTYTGGGIGQVTLVRGSLLSPELSQPKLSPVSFKIADSGRLILIGERAPILAKGEWIAELKIPTKPELQRSITLEDYLGKAPRSTKELSTEAIYEIPTKVQSTRATVLEETTEIPVELKTFDMRYGIKEVFGDTKPLKQTGITTFESEIAQKAKTARKKGISGDITEREISPYKKEKVFENIGIIKATKEQPPISEFIKPLESLSTKKYEPIILEEIKPTPKTVKKQSPVEIIKTVESKPTQLSEIKSVPRTLAPYSLQKFEYPIEKTVPTTKMKSTEEVISKPVETTPVETVLVTQYIVPSTKEVTILKTEASEVEYLQSVESTSTFKFPPSPLSISTSPTYPGPLAKTTIPPSTKKSKKQIQLSDIYGKRKKTYKNIFGSFEQYNKAMKKLYTNKSFQTRSNTKTRINLNPAKIPPW